MSTFVTYVSGSGKGNQQNAVNANQNVEAVLI